MCQTSDLLVMVVDPHEVELNKTCDSLRRVGIMEIICVSDYEEAVDTLSGNVDIDIVIVEFALKPQTQLGLMLCSAMKKKHPSTIFILLSKDYCGTIVLNSIPVAEDIFDKNRDNEIEELIGKWIELAKLKNTTREILNGSKCFC